MASSDEDASFDFELVLLSLLPVLDEVGFLLPIFLILAAILSSSGIITAHV